jgi:hypothetical protein
MTHNVDNIQMLSLSFPDIMTKLYLAWESSEKEKQLLQEEVESYKTTIDEMTTAHTELLKNVKRLQSTNIEYEKEIIQLKKKVEDAEDEQKQFRKVSHIITMDRENSNYKQQIAILERRVAFYQNQCNNMKSLGDNSKIDQQTDTNDLESSDNNITTDKPEDNTNKNDEHIEKTHNDKQEENIDTNITVKEKKIKGVIYYLSDDGDIYSRNDDKSIGEIKGKIEHLSSGKTKVKWYKT